MSQRKSQRVLVLEHLRAKGSISPVEAISLYSIFRLAAVIHTLRGEGWEVLSDLRHVEVEGTVKPYARYAFSEAQKKSKAKPLGAPKGTEPSVGKGTPIQFQAGDQVKVTGAYKKRPWLSGMELDIGKTDVVHSIVRDTGSVHLSRTCRYYHNADLKLVHRKGTTHAEVRQLNEAHEVFYSSAREAGVL